MKSLGKMFVLTVWLIAPCLLAAAQALSCLTEVETLKRKLEGLKRDKRASYHEILVLGQVCSECGRGPKLIWEQENERFNAHVQRVHGVVLTREQKLVFAQESNRKYDAMIEDIRHRFLLLQASCSEARAIQLENEMGNNLAGLQYAQDQDTERLNNKLNFRDFNAEYQEKKVEYEADDLFDSKPSYDATDRVPVGELPSMFAEYERDWHNLAAAYMSTNAISNDDNEYYQSLRTVLDEERAYKAFTLVDRAKSYYHDGRQAIVNLRNNLRGLLGSDDQPTSSWEDIAEEQMQDQVSEWIDEHSDGQQQRNLTFSWKVGDSSTEAAFEPLETGDVTHDMGNPFLENTHHLFPEGPRVKGVFDRTQHFIKTPGLRNKASLIFSWIYQDNFE